MVTFVKRSRWRSLSTFCRCIWCAWVAFLAYTPTSYAEVDASNPQFAFRLEKSIQQNIIDELIYEASINQQATKENLIVLRNVRGQLMVSEQDVVRWKLPIINPDAAVNYKGVRYYATADLPAASYTVNDNQLTMDVVLPVSSFENTNVDMQREIVKPNPPQPGGFFNYDVFARRKVKTIENILGYKVITSKLHLHHFSCVDSLLDTKSYPSNPKTYEIEVNPENTDRVCNP